MSEGRALIVAFQRPTDILLEYSAIEAKVANGRHRTYFTHIFNDHDGQNQAVIFYSEPQVASVMRGELKMDVETFVAVDTASTDDIHRIIRYLHHEFALGENSLETELFKAIVAENRFHFTPIPGEEDDEFIAAIIQEAEEARRRAIYLKERATAIREQIRDYESSITSIQERRRELQPLIQAAEARLANIRARSS